MKIESIFGKKKRFCIEPGIEIVWTTTIQSHYNFNLEAKKRYGEDGGEGMNGF